MSRDIYYDVILLKVLMELVKIYERKHHA